MLQFVDKFAGTPIRDLRSGRQIATLGDPILNPNNLVIEAFYGISRVRPGRVVFTSDIREVGQLGVIVKSKDKLMETDQLVRLKELIDLDFELKGKRVITDKKRKVGKLVDYAIDARSFRVEKLYVRPSVIRSIGKGDLVVGRKQIVEINDEEIVVKDSEIYANASRQASLTPAS